MKGAKQLQTTMINMLPANWDYQERLKFFEQLADRYRKMSREDVYRNDRVVFKTDEGYKTGGKG